MWILQFEYRISSPLITRPLSSTLRTTPIHTPILWSLILCLPHSEILGQESERDAAHKLKPKSLLTSHRSGLDIWSSQSYLHNFPALDTNPACCLFVWTIFWWQTSPCLASDSPFQVEHYLLMSIMYICHLLYPLYCLLYVELIWYLVSSQRCDEFWLNLNIILIVLFFSIPFIRFRQFLLQILIYLIKHPSLWQNPLVIFPHVFCHFISPWIWPIIIASNIFINASKTKGNILCW